MMHLKYRHDVKSHKYTNWGFCLFGFMSFYIQGFGFLNILNCFLIYLKTEKYILLLTKFNFFLKFLCSNCFLTIFLLKYFFLSLVFYGLKKWVEKMSFCNQTDQTTKFDESGIQELSYFILVHCITIFFLLGIQIYY